MTVTVLKIRLNELLTVMLKGVLEILRVIVQLVLKRSEVQLQYRL